MLIGQGDVPHTATFDELLAADPMLPAEGEETDPVVLMYTGGTTGMPKGVLLDQRAELLNVYHITIAFQRGRDSVNLLQTPMFHAASMYAVVGGPALGGHTGDPADVRARGGHGRHGGLPAHRHHHGARP